MDRYWFFTWRTYGTWLPGADGFVGYHRNPDRVIENTPGQPTAEAIPPLERYARQVMAGEPVLLSISHAEALLSQFQETAAYRGWVIDAVAVLPNHVHVVFGVPGDPEPSELLKTWKSYASRALNRLVLKPTAPRWFADGGSKRPLKAEANRIGAICYVRDQEGPLLVWLSADATELANRQRELPGDSRQAGKTEATDVAGSPATHTTLRDTQATDVAGSPEIQQ